MKNHHTTHRSEIDLDLTGSNENASGALLGEPDVHLTIDPASIGKQHGHLIIPVSSHLRAPYQLRIPVCIINGNKPGPAITLIAGLHGDEYEGTLTLHKLARELSENEIHGSLVLLPCINTSGMQTGLRQHPEDGLNLDYAFPGNPGGSISERIAFALTRYFIEPSDLVVDLRSGGRQLQFIPSAAVRFNNCKSVQNSCESAMIAFGAPNSLRLPPSANQSCLQSTVTGLHKDYVQTELGGGISYGIKTLSMAHAGCLNILRHKGMLKDELQLASTRLLEVRDESYYIFSPADGLYEPLSYLGENVWQDEPFANLVTLNSTRQDITPVHTTRNATLIATHPGGFVHEGDMLAIVAEEVQG